MRYIIRHHPTTCFLTKKKFSDVCFSSNVSAYKSNLYIDPAMNIIGPSTHVLDLGVSISSNCFVRLTYIFLICINNAQYPVLNVVPQGTVLGPLLFIIIISDINKDILSSRVISFADDTRVYTNITQIENLFKSLTTFHLAHHCLLIPMYTIV